MPTPTSKTDARVDLYISKAAPFAQEILLYLRDLVHEAAPEAEETIKWSMPFFVYRGVILGNMAAFKAHCSFGLWGAETAKELVKEGAASGGAMGSFGRFASVEELPPRKKLLGYVKQSAKRIDSGERTKSIERPVNRVAKPPVAVPEELLTALKKNKVAQGVFDAFSPSCRKEYVDWVADAKREETRTKRVQQAVEWMAEGKRRNWKYENC